MTQLTDSQISKFISKSNERIDIVKSHSWDATESKFGGAIEAGTATVGYIVDINRWMKDGKDRLYIQAEDAKTAKNATIAWIDIDTGHVEVIGSLSNHPQLKLAWEDVLSHIIPVEVTVDEDGNEESTVTAIVNEVFGAEWNRYGTNTVSIYKDNEGWWTTRACAWSHVNVYLGETLEDVVIWRDDCIASPVPQDPS